MLVVSELELIKVLAAVSVRTEVLQENSTKTAIRSRDCIVQASAHRCLKSTSAPQVLPRSPGICMVMKAIMKGYTVFVVTPEMEDDLKGLVEISEYSCGLTMSSKESLTAVIASTPTRGSRVE